LHVAPPLELDEVLLPDTLLEVDDELAMPPVVVEFEELLGPPPVPLGEALLEQATRPRSASPIQPEWKVFIGFP
jgi:hypothetical protein